MKRLAAVLLLAAGAAWPQCVMCFRTASAQQAERARVLNAGIVLLGVPPFAILGGFCWLAWRRSKSYRCDIQEK